MAHIIINICITNSILWQMFFSSSGSIMWQNHDGLTNATCSNGRNSTGAFWSTNWLTIQLILWLAWFDWFIDDSTDWFTQPWVIQVVCSPLIGDVVWRRRKVCEVWDHIKMGGLRKSDDPPCVAKGDMMDIPLFPDRLTFLLTEVSSAENLRLPSLATSGEADSAELRASYSLFWMFWALIWGRSSCWSWCCCCSSGVFAELARGFVSDCFDAFSDWEDKVTTGLPVSNGEFEVFGLLFEPRELSLDMKS